MRRVQRQVGKRYPFPRSLASWQDVIVAFTIVDVVAVVVVVVPLLIVAFVVVIIVVIAVVLVVVDVVTGMPR